MKIRLEITPRQSGKTTNLIHNFMENYDQSLLIVHSHCYAKDIMKRISEKYLKPTMEALKSKVLTTYQLRNTFRSHFSNHYEEPPRRSVKYLFVDEYLMYSVDQMRELYVALEHLEALEDIFIMTTSAELFQKIDLDIARMLYYDRPEIREYLSQESLKKLERLRYNLIIHPNTNVVCKSDIMRSSMGKDQFRTQFIGEWLV